MHPEQGPGLSDHELGETGGSETVSLLESEIPAHNHSVRALNQPGLTATPTGNIPARNRFYYNGGTPNVEMSAKALAPACGDQPHNNMQPYLTFYFAIAMQGVFPPRT